MNCTNVSVATLTFTLTLVFSLHKHPPSWHQSLLIVVFFSFRMNYRKNLERITIVFMCKSKKEEFK